jgi:hypothetical protein
MNNTSEGHEINLPEFLSRPARKKIVESLCEILLNEWHENREHGAGHNSRGARAGPFEIFDLAGWDTGLAVARYNIPHLESSKEVSRILEEKVSAGELGVKSGKGFYQYTGESAGVLRNRIAHALIEIASWEK